MKINVNGKTMKMHVLFSEKDIQARISEISKMINTDFGSENTLLVLIVLHGGLVFGADLIRNLTMPTEIETVRMRSYIGTQSSGKIELITALPKNLTGKHVLVVEDIIDTGRSLDFLKKELLSLGAASLKICALLDKPKAHELPIQADYVGFEIDNHFVVGYGLDLDGKYRNLPHVAQLLSESE